VQIIADVTGRPLSVVKNHLEAGAVGAALTVAVGLGIHPNMDAVDDLVGIERIVQPDPANQHRYEDLYQIYRDLYTVLVPIHHRLYEVP
jgi:sugar (pentulose or hexulose) kinase